MSVLQPREQANTGARQQHLVLGVGDAVADILIEKVRAGEAERHFAQVVTTGLCYFARVTDLGAKVVIAWRRRLADWGDIVLREGVQKPHARQPRIVAPVDSAADAHGRNARHVRAVCECRADDVELAFNAEKSVAERHDIPLALEFTAAEDGIGLRVERFVEIAHARATRAVLIAGIAGQLPEYESVETRVVGGRLEPERAVR